MAHTRRKLILIITVQCLLLLAKEVSSSALSIPNPFNIITKPVGKIYDLASNASEALTNGIDEVVTTGIVYLRNNTALNCLGIPSELFAKTIDTLLVGSTKAEDVRFYFASQRQPDYVTVVIGEEFSLQGTDFEISRDTIVLVHGFMSSGQESWLRDMKDALLKYDDVNVIVVDWQNGSNTWNYLAAATSTKIVGKQIATLFAHIRQLMFDLNNVDIANDWGKIHFIGHSLGAHISARAAYGIKESQVNRTAAWIVNRITGLDPAQPCFTTADLALKLNKEDAPYVDVIHTNARQLIFLGLGLPEQLGFVDFYPNGGQVQPGCSDIDTSIWSYLLLPKSLIESSICSHGRSHAFLTESINNAVAGNCSFDGHRWNRKYENIGRLLQNSCTEDICPEMGINSINSFPRNEGVFFVPTGEESPFCDVNEEDKELIEKQLETDKRLENSFLSSFNDKVFG